MTWTTAARFYRQLSLVHKVGISIADAVRMAGSVAAGHHRDRSGQWSAGCAGGSQLADQLEGSGEEPLAVALMRAGERSGKVPEMSALIAEHYEHRIQLRGVVISKLVYPVILLHVALMIPALPRVILGNWPAWTLLVGPAIIWFIAIGVGVVELASRRAGITAELMLRPPLSFLGMPMIVANTSQVLRAGLAAGMLIPDALELASGGCGNRAMAQRLRAAAVEVRQGRLPDLAAALRACGFPATEIGMIANAEFAGKLEDVLRQVAVLAEESFRSRAMWTAKVFTGIVYGIALVTAVIVIFSMVSTFYIGPINDTLKEMDNA